jgi:hypothetical protein
MKRRIFLAGVFVSLAGLLNAVPSDDQIELAARALEVPFEEVKSLVEKYHRPSALKSPGAKNAALSTIGTISSGIGKKSISPGFYAADARFVSFDGSAVVLRDPVTDESLSCRNTARITLEYTGGAVVTVLLRVEDIGWGLQATMVEIAKK